MAFVDLNVSGFAGDSPQLSATAIGHSYRCKRHFGNRLNSAAASISTNVDILVAAAQGILSCVNTFAVVFRYCSERPGTGH
jgi:hypothetical protein